MAKFTVVVSLLHKKFTPLEIQEEYTTWADADKAYVHYRGLTELNQSSIEHVDLIEHREEVIRGSASKVRNSNVVTLGAQHAVNC